MQRVRSHQNSGQGKGQVRGRVASQNSLGYKGLPEPPSLRFIECLPELSTIVEPHDTLRGSIPSFFMREIRVVRLTPMRAAAPSAPATRPFVIFKTRTIS